MTTSATTTTSTTTTKKKRTRKAKRGDTAKAIGYVRVSTDDQTTAQQVEALHAHATAHGIDLSTLR